MTWENILPFLIPIIIVEVMIRIYAIIDIYKKDRNVKYISKLAWAIIVSLIIFGWVAYFLEGKIQNKYLNR